MRALSQLLLILGIHGASQRLHHIDLPSRQERGLAHLTDEVNLVDAGDLGQELVFGLLCDLAFLRLGSLQDQLALQI